MAQSCTHTFPLKMKLTSGQLLDTSILIHICFVLFFATTAKEFDQLLLYFSFSILKKNKGRIIRLFYFCFNNPYGVCVMSQWCTEMYTNKR